MQLAGAGPAGRGADAIGGPSEPVTPIKHVVVIFPENQSFDRYFATYPDAANPPGEPSFSAAPDTPAVDGLSAALLTNNPNLHAPFRLDRAQALTCFENAGYRPEQEAVDYGRMDGFVQEARTGMRASQPPAMYCPKDAAGNDIVMMGYFDGNTVTALWNYAQAFAMSDSSFDTMFGPSAPGAQHLIAGETAGVLCGPADRVYGGAPPCGSEDGLPAGSTETPAPAGAMTGTLYGDTDPFWDVCSSPHASRLVAMSGRNIGDALNDAGISWGWFQGGFARNADGKCDSRHVQEAFDRFIGVDPATDPYSHEDYIAHHEPFQFYASTANPQHLPPSSIDLIGWTDQANHQYDLASFWQAAGAGNLPAVAFLKPAAYQDGHPNRADPLDEQQFLVETINHLQSLPEWNSTAVIIAYDDSDGWYDHVAPPLRNTSNTSLDVGCGTADEQDIPARCGYGPRLPLLVVSPFARHNYVSHALTDQTSILRFIEDNWLGGMRLSPTSFDNQAGSLMDLFDFDQAPDRVLFLDPVTGEPARRP